MALTQENRILDREQIQQKILRMAYEIYERNFEEKQLVLAGIYENGFALAQLLAKELQQISTLPVTLMQVTLNKEQLQQEISLEPEPGSLAEATVVLVDDVLNTGKTLAYCVKAFLEKEPKKLEIATLVNRHHPQYPIAATYTGYSLATTLHEHVRVVLAEDEIGAYLL